MRLILLILSFFTICHGKQLDCELKAKNAILMNAESGVVLFEKHAHVPTYPASTTKIATALYILDQNIDLDEKLPVSREALKGRPPKDWDILPPYWLDSDGVMMGLRVGEILTVDTLLHGLILSSSNDAANVLAENLGGTVPKFMQLVNEYLEEIGCKNTQFRNPHGLTHPDHWTTAYDLALMTKKALKIPKFRNLIATRLYQKPKTNKQSEGEICLSNPLLKPKSRHYYPKSIGGKTGYTAAAQYNFVSVAEDEGRTLIAVLLGCPDRETSFKETKKLFEKAFSEPKRTRRLIGPETIFKKQLSGAKLPVKTSLVKPLILEYYPSEEPRCKAVLHWKADRLPVSKGQVMGEVHILSEDDRFLQKGELIARENVKGTLFFAIKQKIVDLFK